MDQYQYNSNCGYCISIQYKPYCSSVRLYRTSLQDIFAHGWVKVRGESLLPNTGNGIRSEFREKRGCGRWETDCLGASCWLNYSSMICGLYISCQDSCDKTHYCNTLEILKLFFFCFIIYELS